MAKYQFKFTVLGKYPARLKDNETAVTVNVAAGNDDRLVHAGTLTMSEAEFDALIGALKPTLKQSLEVEDHTKHS